MGSPRRGAWGFLHRSLARAEGRQYAFFGMVPLGVDSMKRLLEAVEILHSHGKGAFHERLFQAAALLHRSEPLGYSFEMYGAKKECLALHTDLTFDSKNIGEMMARVAELVPRQNPIYHEIARGEKEPMRLSDFVSHREFRKTDLYQDVFRACGVKHHMAIPIHTHFSAGGLTVNFHDRDVSDEEMAMATVFGRHVAVAFESDQILQASAGAAKQMMALDFSQLGRLGLSPRECEVLCWVAEGKRDGEIAVILGISIRTVQIHVRSILKKLHVETRTAAVATCLRAMSKGE